jgi:tRNA 2-thiouridine synthesizing protein A
MADQTLDATLLNCPEPIIRTRKVLRTLQPGQTLQVLATDPGAVLDFQAFCRITGNPLLEMSETDGVYRFLIHKASKSN